MNTEVLIRVPTDPPPEEFTESIAEIIRDIEEIAFALLPEMYIPGQMSKPSLVLVIVTDADGPDLTNILNKLHGCITSTVPENSYLDVLPLKPGIDDELLNAAILTGCLVEINDQEMFERCHEIGN